MEIKKVRVHTCNAKIEGYIVDKCRCRKFVSTERAAELLNDGYARNVIISFAVVEIKEVCQICGGTELKKSCDQCKKLGYTPADKLQIELGEDIYMRPFLKTPRTATVEQEHIEYAYINEDKDAIKRIELYHGLTIEMLASMGAAVVDTKSKKILYAGSPEPKDNFQKATGRRYDYGRSI